MHKLIHIHMHIYKWCNGYLSGNGHGDSSSYPDRSCLPLDCTKIHWKGMNTTILPTAMGK